MEQRREPKTAPFDGADGYLKTQRIKVAALVVAAALLLCGFVVWLLLGSVNRTVTGYAQVTGGYYVDCIVPASRIDEVALGQTVWVGNSSGPITGIKSRYVTYDEVVSLFSYSADRLHLSEDETYYYVRADITDEKTGYNKFTIVIDTMTPFAYYFGA